MPRDVRRPSPTCVLSMGCATMLPSYALYSAPRLAFGKGRYARPPAGGCPSMPHGIATSPAGRGKGATMRVQVG